MNAILFRNCLTAQRSGLKNTRFGHTISRFSNYNLKNNTNVPNKAGLKILQYININESFESDYTHDLK